MTDDTSPPRRVVVRVTARERDDPDALLNAVRNALSGHGVGISLRPSGEDDPPPPAPVVKDEVLETTVRELAQAVLEAAAAEADKKRAAAERDAERMREEVAAARAGARAYLSYWLGQGVRITVEFYGKVLDVVAGVVGGVAGKKKGE